MERTDRKCCRNEDPEISYLLETLKTFGLVLYCSSQGDCNGVKNPYTWVSFEVLDKQKDPYIFNKLAEKISKWNEQHEDSEWEFDASIPILRPRNHNLEYDPQILKDLQTETNLLADFIINI